MKQRHKTTKGFTLIEMMISIFIFVIIMTASVTVFSSHIKAHAYAREVQRNLENAQFAFNFIGKVLRTGTIVAQQYDTETNALITNENEKVIYLHDYSQNKCFKFAYDDSQKAIVYESINNGGSASEVDTDRCGIDATYSATDSSYVGPVKLTTGEIANATFTYQPSRRGKYDFAGNAQERARIGYVTMSAAIVDETVDEGHVWLQTSVSLRDYPGELSF